MNHRVTISALLAAADNPAKLEMRALSSVTSSSQRHRAHPR
jgi:hypothetical protein